MLLEKHILLLQLSAIKGDIQGPDILKNQLCVKNNEHY